jgi:Xaa-Pro aminopeptidase
LRLGIDPWLHSGAEVRRLEKALAGIGGSLVILPHNPLDRLWTDRPQEPLGAVAIQNDRAGRRAGDRQDRHNRRRSRPRNLKAVLIADPSSIAWIFNIRGADVPHTPHPLARAIIHADGKAELFLDKRKTGIEAEAYLAQMCTQLAPSALEEQGLPPLSRMAAGCWSIPT